RQPGYFVGEIGVARFLPFFAIALRHDRQHEQLEVVYAQRLAALALDFAMGAEQRRLAHSQVQVRACRLHQHFQHLAEALLGSLELGRREFHRQRNGSDWRLDPWARVRRRGSLWGRRRGGGGGGGAQGGGSRRRQRRSWPNRRDHGGQSPRFRYDPDPDQALVGRVVELGLRVIVDLVRRLGRRHLDHERVNVLVCERLLGDSARLPVLDERDRLVGQQIQLVRLLAQH